MSRQSLAVKRSGAATGTPATTAPLSFKVTIKGPDGLGSASRSMTSAADVAPGRYYFVVVVDPENANGAYRMHRSEFAI